MPIIDHPECSIYPGCTYNVTVESTDRTIQKSIILLVPGEFFERSIKLQLKHLPQYITFNRVREWNMLLQACENLTNLIVKCHNGTQPFGNSMENHSFRFGARSGSIETWKRENKVRQYSHYTLSRPVIKWHCYIIRLFPLKCWHTKQSIAYMGWTV